jgi:hypothetical protein
MKITYQTNEHALTLRMQIMQAKTENIKKFLNNTQACSNPLNYNLSAQKRIPLSMHTTDLRGLA